MATLSAGHKSAMKVPAQAEFENGRSDALDDLSSYFAQFLRVARHLAGGNTPNPLDLCTALVQRWSASDKDTRVAAVGEALRSEQRADSYAASEAENKGEYCWNRLRLLVWSFATPPATVRRQAQEAYKTLLESPNEDILMYNSRFNDVLRKLVKDRVKPSFSEVNNKYLDTVPSDVAKHLERHEAPPPGTEWTLAVLQLKTAAYYDIEKAYPADGRCGRFLTQVDVVARRLVICVVARVIKKRNASTIRRRTIPSGRSIRRPCGRNLVGAAVALAIGSSATRACYETRRLRLPLLLRRWAPAVRPQTRRRRRIGIAASI